MRYNYQEVGNEIYEAIYYDDWGRASKTFKDHPELRTTPTNVWLETPLMIAVGTNRSHDFVKTLLYSLSKDDLIGNALAAENHTGDTVFHYAAKIGNMIDAQQLVLYSREPRELLMHENANGHTPLMYAALFGRKKEMLELFFSFTATPIIVTGLLLNAIDAGFLDIASKLVESFASPFRHQSWQLQRTLHFLAQKPELFYSPSKLGVWRRCIYHLLPFYPSKEVSSFEKKTMGRGSLHHDLFLKKRSLPDEEAMIYRVKEFAINPCGAYTSTTFLKRIFQYLASPFKEMHDLKQARHLVKRICAIVKEKDNPVVERVVLGSAIQTAVEYGNYAIFRECISACPSIIWSDGLAKANLFHEAIKHRQEEVYSLVYEMSRYKALVFSEVDETTKENILHIAAKLGPSHRLNTITGAALQMQRELQWFQEIESIVEPSLKGGLNTHNKTPEMVFNDEHKDLLKEGKEWMKDTASSSTVVAALIVTVAFAAIFTLPGGEANKGKIAFKLFIISDAIALFSSATSALLFLGILTSRYAQKDFLDVLPRRLVGGLFSLFLSLAATMIAFSATLALVLQHEIPWIATPLYVITSIPIGMFVWIQLPLLYELAYSTFGPNIFRK